VSQQLGYLLREGLISSRREGQKVFYRVIDPFLDAVCDAVCQGLRARSREVAGLAVPAHRAPSRRKTR
jgi:hypothetical protein